MNKMKLDGIDIGEMGEIAYDKDSNFEIWKV
jgi:hypothetical protein